MSPQSPLLHDLLALGVRPGGVLMVHSSLRSLGPLPEKAAAVVHALVDALGTTGTLLMPALSYETVRSNNPVFDVRNTPSCVGALPEYFRTQVQDVIRSVHPTHSVCAFGYRAEELTRDHIRATTPCGPESPFAKLPHVGGQILFLGCGMRCNTSMHAIEEHIVPPYLYADELDYHVILSDGSETTMRVRPHNFQGWQQRYDRLEQVQQHGLKKGRVLEAECYLVDATEMWFAALSTMRNDPLFFVDKIS
jgi:aminoglycoside 3-N-acetyltransferase